MMNDDGLDIPTFLRRTPMATKQTTTAVKEPVPGPEDLASVDARAAPEGQLPANVAQHRSVSASNGHAHEVAYTVTAAFAGQKIGQVAKAISEVSRKIEPIAKRGTNTHFNYKFDRMDDLMEQLSPLIAEAGLVIMQNEVDYQVIGDGAYLVVRYDHVVAHTSGEVWPERIRRSGMSTLKTRNGWDDKAMSKCSTQAIKFFYKRMFNIPIDTGDDEEDQGRHRQAPRGEVASPGGTPRTLTPHSREPFQMWAERYIAAFSTATSVADLFEWDKLNDEFLGRLEHGNNELYLEVLKKFEALRDKLSGDGVAQEAAGSEAPRREAPKEASPALPKGCPDPAEKPEDFLSWLDKQMGRLKDHATLTSWYNDRAQPLVDMLKYPSDQDEAAGLFGKHERRFE